MSNDDKVGFALSRHTCVLDRNGKEVSISMLLTYSEMMAYCMSRSVKSASAQATIEKICRAFAQDNKTPLFDLFSTQRITELNAVRARLVMGIRELS